MIYCMATREPVTIVAQLPQVGILPVDVRVRYPGGEIKEISSARLIAHRGWEEIGAALEAAPVYFGRLSISILPVAAFLVLSNSCARIRPAENRR